MTNNFHYPEIPFHTLWNDHLNSTSSNLFFAPLTSLFAHASLRILDCKIKYANGQTDMLIYSPPTPAIIPTLWFHYFSIKSWTFNPFLYCRRESSVKGFKLTFLSLDFYRNSLNDIILIYELVGVKLLTKFFYRISLCKQIFKSRTWLSWFSLRLMQKFNFIACTLETKMLSMLRKTWKGRETGYYTIDWRLQNITLALFDSHSTLMLLTHKLRRYAELQKWGKIPLEHGLSKWKWWFIRRKIKENSLNFPSSCSAPVKGAK